MRKKLFTLMLALVAIVTTAQAQNTINGHEYVDLGLPSGTLWATCNVGANSPEDYGDYFAWGETKGYKNGKTNFSWSTYSLCNESANSLTKYCTKSSFGTVDNRTELEAEDDAAYVNWGNPWQMPSKEQQDELRKECTYTWTQLNGVEGFKVTGTNGNFIFIPNGGYFYGTKKDGGGGYWSRSIRIEEPSVAYDLCFAGYRILEMDYISRCNGDNVRPIIDRNAISDGIGFVNKETIVPKNWHSVDGVKLQGEPTRKGIYIRNGKKVVK